MENKEHPDLEKAISISDGFVKQFDKRVRLTYQKMNDDILKEDRNLGKAQH